MQHSPFEIKEKLLRALDEDNNVVDMAAVLEVISILEKTPITKDVLEKTRLGRYVNKLRKKTSDERLARRAKELIKNWKKLLPQVEPVLNGERDSGPTSTPPIGITSGPGPGGDLSSVVLARSGNRNVSLARLKPTSPAVRPENTASPQCSSSSNSPLSLSSCSRPFSGHSGATYAPPAKGVGAFSGIGGDKNSHTSNGNVAAAHSVNQVFKPVSPALAAVHHNASARPITPGSASQPLARPKPHSPVVGNSSKQRSPCLSVPGKLHPGKRDKQSAFSEFPPSPQLSPAAARGSSSAHSNLEVAKTNVANKRLRKDANQSVIPKKKMCVPPSVKPSSPRVSVMNGAEVSPSREKMLGGSSCNFAGGDAKPKKNAAKHCTSSGSAVAEDKPSIKGPSLNVCHNKRVKGKLDPVDVLKEKSAVCISGGGGNSSPRLKKVKTTQQLVADLQAKCSRSGSLLNLPIGDIPNSSGNYSLLGCDAETSKTKSELMDRFLQSAGSSSHASSHSSTIKSDKESREPVLQAASKQPRMTMGQNVPDENACTTLLSVDPISREIDVILSKLPPINMDEINWDEEEEVIPSPKEVTREDVDRLNVEHWEKVNGNTDHENNWREWHETTTLVSHDGCLLHILPYVNIDW